MACQEISTCTCNICNPTYTEIGCCEYISTDCVVYKGEDIPCLEIETNENVTQIIGHLKDVICSLDGNNWGDFDFSCFASEGITTEKEFVEFISSVLCEVLGDQVPGGITSLSTLNSLILALTTQVNLIKNQTLIPCFQTLSGLGTPQNISILLASIQTIICDLDSRITGANTPITAINFEKDVNIDVSGLDNHTITANVVLDPDIDNAITTSNVGLLVVSPSVAAVDTPSINFTTSGIKNHTITGDVRISATAGNGASILADGLYVNPAAGSETPLVASDSTSIDFTQSGVNGHSISATVIVNPSLTNILQSTPSGLLVESSAILDPIVPTDTQSIDLTVSGISGHNLRADVVVSPTANNALTTLANGLYVNSAVIIPNAWLMLGNNNIVDGTHFVGTTTNVPLNFRVNNQRSGRLTATGASLFGYQAGLNTLTNQITAFGYQALKLNTTGTSNVALGSNTLAANTSGTDNVALGDVALTICTGSYNTAVGGSTLQKIVASVGNTALGYSAGSNYAVGSELVGDYNTFLGFGAINKNGFPNISKSTAIGYSAFVSANNNMVLGGTGADKVSVVIGASEAVPTAVLQADSTTQGFLPPRMNTTQRDAIPTPAQGLVIFNTTTIKLECYDGTIWQAAW